MGMHHIVGQGQCSLPGCKDRYLSHPRTREEMGYCCEDHRLRATQRSLGPNPEQFVDRTFRGGTTSAADFQLSALLRRHPEYTSLKKKFLQKWQKSELAGGVSVLRIFKVQVPRDIQKKSEEYQDTKTNVRRRFHGTSCSSNCNFFVDLRGGACGEDTCNVCSICTHGFKLKDNVGKTARRTKYSLRYGEGLYFSSVSGKANDYADESQKTSIQGKMVRCMFKASVTIGRSYRAYDRRLDPAQNECPPPGYDSVTGEVHPIPGKGLNYDEVVVYKEEAALPTHLIAYYLN